MRILVVDDEAPVRHICERTLRECGHEVTTAASGSEAAGLIARAWDIILTDIHLPGAIDGFELLDLAKQAGDADTLMMTAFPEMDAAIRAIKLGAHDSIIKPFTPDALEAAVERCARQRELRTQLTREKALRVESERARAEMALMQKIKNTFGLFLTSEVVDYILSRPEGVGREGTLRKVMFVDVRKFTSFAQASAPEKVVQTINEIFSLVVSAVHREGGIVNKFMGDGRWPSSTRRRIFPPTNAPRPAPPWKSRAGAKRPARQGTGPKQVLPSAWAEGSTPGTSSSDASARPTGRNSASSATP